MAEPRRFFCEHWPAVGESFELSDEVARHVRVLRLKRGDSIMLFNEGRQVSAVIEEVSGSTVVCAVLFELDATPPDEPLILILALAKSKQLQNAVRAATELGVSEIRLMTTERSVPTWRSAEAKRARLNKIVVEAARQSGRSDVPMLAGPVAFEEAIVVPADCAKFAFALSADPPDPSHEQTRSMTAVVVGPEGGLTLDECDVLRAHGYRCVRLGNTILRVETAVPVVLSYVRFGDSHLR